MVRLLTCNVLQEQSGNLNNQTCPSTYSDLSKSITVEAVQEKESPP